MIWLALAVIGLLWLHFTPRDSVRETCAATLALSSTGVAIVEMAMLAR